MLACECQTFLSPWPFSSFDKGHGLAQGTFQQMHVLAEACGTDKAIKLLSFNQRRPLSGWNVSHVKSSRKV